MEIEEFDTAYLNRAAIITIGTELVEGLRTDENGPAIARSLSRIGFSVEETISVGDDADLLSRTYERLCSDYSLVVSTGGLGPTHDDVTRESAAHALGLELIPDDHMIEMLRPFAERQATPEAVEECMTQALLIEGAELLVPSAGTAPGQVVPTPAGKLLLLPGPPAECMPLLDLYMTRFGSTRVDPVDFSIFGINESTVQHRVQTAIGDFAGIGFTVLASPVEVHAILIDMGIGAAGLAKAGECLRGEFGDLIFSESGESLAKVVVDLAQAKGLTLSTAESCTGGLISGAITSVPGSSSALMGGIVSYSNSVKVSGLGVSEATLAAYGAVSEETAHEMAVGARSRLGADLAVSVTGVAGPDGGTPEKPVGTVWFAVASPRGVRTLLRTTGGPREGIRKSSVSAALDLLRRELLEF